MQNETIQQTPPPPKTLPTSYVLWLTIRSKFIDELALHNPEILSKWKEFEDKQLLAMEEQNHGMVGNSN